jgi:stringent starvation protein B
LKLGNEFIEFKARFGGKPREIMVPIHRVMAIYARENGQGMAFPVPDEELAANALSPVDSPVVEAVDSEEKPSSPHPSTPGRPALKRIK